MKRLWYSGDAPLFHQGRRGDRGSKSVRVIPVDIYDFAQEIQLIKKLPKDSCVGIVSLVLHCACSGTLHPLRR